MHQEDSEASSATPTNKNAIDVTIDCVLATNAGDKDSIGWR